MQRVKTRNAVSSICRDPDAGALSRRDMLAGLGLAALFVAAPTVLTAYPAKAGPADTPAVAPERPADATKAVDDRAVEGDADATEFSAWHRYWHRPRWRRRYWHRVHWRRRYWRRRHWHRVYWRRRHWRRRYWRRRYLY